MNSTAKFLLRKRRCEQIKEIRASEKLPPADQAVKLLMEMEDAARRKIISKGEIKNNLIECTYLAFSDNMQVTGQALINLVIRLKINGREHTISKFLSYDMFQVRHPKFGTSPLFRNEVEGVVAQYLVSELYKDFLELFHKKHN